MITIAIANHKGGVGKTATAHALGAGLTDLGQRVLLVDIDPQGSLTAAAGVEDATGQSLAEVYHPIFLCNQFGMLERCALRNGNVHSADGWRDVLWIWPSLPWLDSSCLVPAAFRP